MFYLNTFTFGDYDNERPVNGLFTWMKAIPPTNYCHLTNLFIISDDNGFINYIESKSEGGEYPFTVCATKVDSLANGENKYHLNIHEK